MKPTQELIAERSAVLVALELLEKVVGALAARNQQAPEHRVGEPLAIRVIRTAVDRGIIFMDNCWDYNEGASEIRMGKALRDGYRDRVFLMTKIDGRSKNEAARPGMGRWTSPPNPRGEAAACAGTRTPSTVPQSA